MKFLAARQAIDNFKGGPELQLDLALSGSPEPFDLYLRACAAQRGRGLTLHAAPFGTLAQRLRTPADASRLEVLLLFPWDFVPEADWRSGIPVHADEQLLRGEAEKTAELLLRRTRAGTRILFVPADTPPMFSDPGLGASLDRFLQALALGVGASLVPAEAFSLGGYLSSGCPVGGSWIGRVSEMIVHAALLSRPETRKVLVTDLDNVMWAGGIAEDGAEGIAFKPQGKGYRHFLYQTLLRRLRADGAILAAVSRNDRAVAVGPLQSRQMTLADTDFVSIIASYHAKSSQIQELATRLNLGLDSFVFVDDNPVELAEVSLALPQVECVAFPAGDEEFAGFLSGLASWFARAEITAEDRERTERYRRMLDGIAPSAVDGADLTGFLQSLQMRLTLHERTHADRTRAVQLINKTNQFNQNGRRISDDEVAGVLSAGGRLFGASLADRSGTHGEILACLLGPDRVISAFVMSCRVFQRRVEHAFLAWLMSQPDPPVALDWARTPRNEPFATFLSDLTGAIADSGRVSLDAARVQTVCEPALSLFSIDGP